MEQIFKRIKNERLNADAKFGEQNHNLTDWIAIIGEEYGEAAREAVDFKFKNPVDGGFLGMVKPTKSTQRKRLKNYENELIQLAGVTIAAIESLHRNEFVEYGHLPGKESPKQLES